MFDSQSLDFQIFDIFLHIMILENNSRLSSVDNFIVKLVKKKKKLKTLK